MSIYFVYDSYVKRNDKLISCISLPPKTSWNLFENLNRIAFQDLEDQGIKNCLMLLSAQYFEQYRTDCKQYVDSLLTICKYIKIIVIDANEQSKISFMPVEAHMISMIFPRRISNDLIIDMTHQTIHLLQLSSQVITTQEQLTLTTQESNRMINIGHSLATEHNFERLLSLILEELQHIVLADSGSIYVIEPDKKKDKPTHLRFKTTSLMMDVEEFLLPISKHSIAGYVALTGKELVIDDVYQLEDQEYQFNSKFDEVNNYRTKSMMVIPLINHLNEVIGVIQLINRKKDIGSKKTGSCFEYDDVVTFSERDLCMATSFAGQASVSLQNSLFIHEIYELLESFVQASVKAIEQRDPTTAGHSYRVATYTDRLAQAINECGRSEYANVHFGDEELREIRYAALLHDFGKVGVREEVLLKAKKLYPREFEAIYLRYYLILKDIESQYYQEKLSLLQQCNPIDDQQLETLKNKKESAIRRTDYMLKMILDASEPSILHRGEFQKLQQCTYYGVKNSDGTTIPFLKESELFNLSVTKGTLNEFERKEIESHVVNTYLFLSQISWTQDLHNIPKIAYGHHEKLDGSGYPLKLTAKSIPLSTRMMTIADMYDALTAPDRPYKQSISEVRALDILQAEATKKHIDSNLLELFINKNLFAKVATKE